MISTPPSPKHDVIFRVDASIDIGTGHVMRCLTLADMLSNFGFECRFVCRDHPGSMMRLIRHRGFAVSELPRPKEQVECHAGEPAHSHWLGVDWQTDARQTLSAIGRVRAAWLIVDHYALDWRWERFLRPSIQHLMVVDDLADREHCCELLFDQSLGRSEADYRLLVPSDCQLLVGARYALLRPQFLGKRAYSLARRRDAEPRRLLVTLGGVDKDNITERVLCSLYACALPKEADIIVVMGAHAPWLDAVRGRAARMPWKTRVVSNVDDMAALMSDADLAIGAAGGTSWERCALGVPTVMMVLAGNQREIAGKLASAGAARIVELGADFGDGVRNAVESLFSDKSARDIMSDRAAAICDGAGGLDVARHIAGRIARHG
ncbi:UDP-2,4-diacetamido-2,4,6-trideoxy-beta-L-altropyranose hydrolase [compost metagenome]